MVLPENIGKVKKSNCVKFSRYYRVSQRVFINSFDPNIIYIIKIWFYFDLSMTEFVYSSEYIFLIGLVTAVTIDYGFE